MKRRHTRPVLALGLALLAHSILHAAPPASGPCDRDNISAQALVGLWQVTLDRTPSSTRTSTATAEPAGVLKGRLQLQPHPDYPGSLRGTLQWGQRSLLVAADLDGDDFTLEESDDGRRISATWVGQLVAGHCGQRIEGQRLGQGGADAVGPNFRLQRR